ncbi:MAG: glycosyl hydrolase family 28-related protein [Bacteroidia bacterium]|nr:glycosyl hydrolase family 28-related protein [Bacteroidia bacterium]
MINLKNGILFFLTVTLILCLGLIYTLEQNTTKDTNYPFNVKNFGAKGDHKTDDTKAIQAAINAAVSHGGGTVYFPDGVYQIGGPAIDSVNHQRCSSQLYIPVSTLEHPINIVFKGETAPEFELQGLIKTTPSMNGSILLSTLITSDSTQFVIGMVRGQGKNWRQWNYSTPSFFNLGIRTSTTKQGDTVQVRNSLGGINLAYASKSTLDNILITTQSPLASILNPTGTGSVALVTPKVDNHAQIDIGLIRIGGYDYGIKFSEHFVAQDVQIVCCNIGFLSEFSHHSSSVQTLEIECVRYPIVFRPGHNLMVANYNTEHLMDNVWYRFVQDVTFEGKSYFPAKIVIGLCNPVVSNVGYNFNHFKTNDSSRVVLLENAKVN